MLHSHGVGLVSCRSGGKALVQKAVHHHVGVGGNERPWGHRLRSRHLHREHDLGKGGGGGGLEEHSGLRPNARTYRYCFVPACTRPPTLSASNHTRRRENACTSKTHPLPPPTFIPQLFIQPPYRDWDVVFRPVSPIVPATISRGRQAKGSSVPRQLLTVHPQREPLGFVPKALAQATGVGLLRLPLLAPQLLLPSDLCCRRRLGLRPAPSLLRTYKPPGTRSKDMRIRPSLQNADTGHPLAQKTHRARKGGSR
jgi:hypothetical protein